MVELAPLLISKDAISGSAIFSGDEVDFSVSIRNNHDFLREYRVEVVAYDGVVLDKEPDLSWKNIAPGSSATIIVSSRWDPSWDVFRIGSLATIIVRTQDGRIAGALMLNLTRDAQTIDVVKQIDPVGSGGSEPVQNVVVTIPPSGTTQEQLSTSARGGSFFQFDSNTLLILAVGAVAIIALSRR